MKLGARNVLGAKLRSVTHGAVDSEVVLEVGAGVERVSIITRSSAERVGLAPGNSVHALVKASSVMVATDD